MFGSPKYGCLNDVCPNDCWPNEFRPNVYNPLPSLFPRFSFYCNVFIPQKRRFNSHIIDSIPSSQNKKLLNHLISDSPSIGNYPKSTGWRLKEDLMLPLKSLLSFFNFAEVNKETDGSGAGRHMGTERITYNHAERIYLLQSKT